MYVAEDGWEGEVVVEEMELAGYDRDNGSGNGNRAGKGAELPEMILSTFFRLQEFQQRENASSKKHNRRGVSFKAAKNFERKAEKPRRR